MTSGASVDAVLAGLTPSTNVRAIYAPCGICDAVIVLSRSVRRSTS